MKKPLFASLSLSLILFLGFDQLKAGTVDLSFGSNNTGYAIFDGNNIQWKSVAITPSGNIVVAGYDIDNKNNGIVAQYSSSGTLEWQALSTVIDGNNGVALTSVAITPSGNIVVAGYDIDNKKKGIVAQYSSSGTLEWQALFTAIDGNNGVAWTSVATTSDGNIVVAGYDNSIGIVAQYTSAGALDTANFGNNNAGYVTFNETGKQGYWKSVAIKQDGNIVVAGNDDGNGIVARYTSTGDLDTANFGNNTGYVKFNQDTGKIVGWSSVAIKSDGKIVVAGVNGYDIGIVAQYTSAGALDTANFGNNNTGYVEFKEDKKIVFWNSVAIKQDGNIVVAGYDNGNGIVAQYTSAGALDTANFGNNTGYVKFNHDTGKIVDWNSVAITPDGKIIVAGHDTSNDVVDGIVACYFGDYPNTPAGFIEKYAGINLGFIGGIQKANA